MASAAVGFGDPISLPIGFPDGTCVVRRYQPVAALLREGGWRAGHFVTLAKEQGVVREEAGEGADADGPVVVDSWVMFDDKIDRSRPQPLPDLAAARYNGATLQELVVAVGYLLVPDEGVAAVAAPVLSGSPPAEPAASAVAQPPTATPIAESPAASAATADSALALAVSARPSAASATASASASASASAPVQAGSVAATRPAASAPPQPIRRRPCSARRATAPSSGTARVRSRPSSGRSRSSISAA